MGNLFRKRIGLGKFFALNLSKSGIGLSIGPRGAKFSINPKRARVQLGIPGTGIGYRQDYSVGGQPGGGQEVQAASAGPDTAVCHPKSHRLAWVTVWLLLAVALAAMLLSGCDFLV